MSPNGKIRTKHSEVDMAAQNAQGTWILFTCEFRVHNKGVATAMSADTPQESQELLSHQEYWALSVD